MLIIIIFHFSCRHILIFLILNNVYPDEIGC